MCVNIVGVWLELILKVGTSELKIKIKNSPEVLGPEDQTMRTVLGTKDSWYLYELKKKKL